MSYDVVTFGETMIRLSAPDYKRLEQTETMNVNVGGSESSVAIAVRRLGLNSAFVTRLTSNPLGRMIANKVRKHGVDTSHIVWTDKDRVGKYYLEQGANPRPSSVIYDRKDSAISKIKPGSPACIIIFLPILIGIFSVRKYLVRDFYFGLK